MMKTLALVLMVALSASIFASHKASAADEIKCAADSSQGIGIDPDYVIQQVTKAKSCDEASHIVESCAAGSSMDNSMAGSAVEACDRFTGKIKKSDALLKRVMNARCAKVCNPQTDGTICQSQQSFCRLSVSKFINSVNISEN